MNAFPALVQKSLVAARRKHPAAVFNVHDGYGRLMEEVQEFFDEVRKQDADRDKAALLKELTHIATVAQRIAEDLKLVC